MITEFLIAGAGLYIYRKTEKLVKEGIPKIKNKIEQYKHRDLLELNEIWCTLLHNVGLENKQGETFSIYKAKEVPYGYYLILNIPSGKNFEDLNKIKDTIQNAFGAVVLLSETKTKKYIAMEIYDKVPERIQFTPVKTKPYQILLGYEYSGKAVLMDMSKFFNLVVGGVVGTGKSRLVYVMLTNLIVNHTPEEVEIFMAQTKKSDLSIFSKAKNVKMFATSLEEATAVFQKVIRIIESRNKRFNEAQCLDINEYNEENQGRKMSRVYLFVEESSFLMTDECDNESEKESKSKIKRALREITRTGRFAGVNVIMVTQRATAEMLDPSQKTNFCRVTGRQMSAINSQNIIESTDAVGLENGEFILFENDYRRFRTPIIDKNIVKEHIGTIDPVEDIKEDIKESCMPITVECTANIVNDISDLDPRVFNTILEIRNKRKGPTTLQEIKIPDVEIEVAKPSISVNKDAKQKPKVSRNRKNVIQVALDREV